MDSEPRKSVGDYIGAFIAIVIFVLVVSGIILLTQAVVNDATKTTPVTGKVVKLWIETCVQVGCPNDYTTLEMPDGSLRVVGVYPAVYGILETGATCTFDVQSNNWSRHATCAAKR
jgi:uncharacterized protein YjeT (DUF2065 family)